MKKIVIATLVGALLYGLGGMALAQEQYKKKTVIDFDEVLLEGELKKPAGAMITERGEMKFDTMIKVRTNFEKEMLKSVDVLK